MFRDYKRTGDIQDFKKLNIIYGWNYSGKTTIARLFNCFEKEELNSDYANCEFEILDLDDRKYSNVSLSIPNTDIRVFDSDFIRKNLKWDGETFDPILLLGEESIEAKAEIEIKKKKIEKIDKLIGSVNQIHTGLTNEIESGLTNTASTIKIKLELVDTFTKIHLRPIFEAVRQNVDVYMVDSTKEQELLKQAKASEDDKLPEIQEINLSINLSQLIDEVKELVKKVPEISRTIDFFLENPEVAKWVETGLKYHEGKNECNYCGNIIPEKRKDELLAHFSEDLKNHKTELQSLSERIEASKLQVSQLEKRDLYPLFRDEFEKISISRNESLKNYNKQLDELNKIIQLKSNTPFEAITDFSTITDYSTTVLQHNSDFNEVIRKNNKNTEEFDNNKKSAITELKNHYVGELVQQLDLANRENKIALYEAREQRLRAAKQSLSKEIQQIEAQISNAQKGREKLNKYIHSFLGREEINVEVIKDGENEYFTLKRNDDKAINLSEGEKTAIAFSFFLTKLLELEDLKTAIVYIDDPVSSLDSNHIFQVNALLKDFFFHKHDENSSWELKCDQLFVSTHNFDFFTLLRELPKADQQHSYYFVKRISADEATISKLPSAIQKYNSEYHYLFKEIYDFNKSSNKTDYGVLQNIPNAVRRFTELYTYSRLPGNRSSTVDIRADQLWGAERSKRILKVFHYFSHSNNIERMTKNSDLICDIEYAVSDLIDEIKKDPLHYKELVKSIS